MSRFSCVVTNCWKQFPGAIPRLGTGLKPLSYPDLCRGLISDPIVYATVFGLKGRQSLARG